MEKNNRVVFIICIVTVLFLCSCGSDLSDFIYIDTTKTTGLLVACTPAYQIEYSTIPSELQSILRTVDKGIAEQESPIQSTGNDIDFPTSGWEDILYISLEQNDDSCIMITIYLISEEDCYIKCINHSKEEVQTEIASFLYRNPQFIKEVRSVQSTLDA